MSTIGSGVLADRLEKKSLMAKSYVSIASALIGIPMIMGACFFEGTSFYVSLAFLFIKFALTEGWMAPTVTMM